MDMSRGYELLTDCPTVISEPRVSFDRRSFHEVAYTSCMDMSRGYELLTDCPN